MSKQDIIVVGSSNTDMIIRLDHIPRHGETILGGEFFTAAGGKGANQAAGAARAGGKVTLVEGIALEEAVRFANAAAALSVTGMGAQSFVPARMEIEEFLRNNG